MKTRTYRRLSALAVSTAVAYAIVLQAHCYSAITNEKATSGTAKSLVWTQATPAAGWSARSGHVAVVFQDKLWVLGGYDIHNDCLNDVWSSTDGQNWTPVLVSAPWPARRDHAVMVFQGRIWVMGGRAISVIGNLNDVWCSSNGFEWENVVEDAPWSPRYDFGANVFGGSIFVLGGFGSLGESGTQINDIWSSPDGESWMQVSPHALWVERESAQCAVFRDRLWMLGGVRSISESPWSVFLNDVWSTLDGITWSQICDAATWHARSSHAVAVFKNQLWVLGGGYITGSGPGAYIVRLHDVWNSADGADWTQEPDAPWSPRAGHTVAVFDNKLWILGGWAQDPGKDSSPVNDVWYAETDPNAAFSGTPVSGDAPLAVDFTD